MKILLAVDGSPVRMRAARQALKRARVGFEELMLVGDPAAVVR